MRRSSRLRGKKRVNYNEDALWYKAAGTTKQGWDKMVQKESSDPVPSFRKVQQFRKADAAVPKRKPLQIVRTKLKLTKVEQDAREVNFNPSEMESAQTRVDRVLKDKIKLPKMVRQPLSRKRKHLLFMNPGDEVIGNAVRAINFQQPLPAWAKPFQDLLSIGSGRLQWTEGGKRLPFALKSDKRAVIKRLYFDPREPSTIIPITLRLYEDWANINKRNITSVLRSLETYQLNKGRRRPPDLKNRMILKNPGMIAMDMFFPSQGLGWEKTNVLVCMDTWSRYCGVYVLDTKRIQDVLKGMVDFLAKFSSLGHPPRRILCDKGTDMKAAYTAIERYRQAKDEQKPMVLHTATGMPVAIVEALNAQVQRRMQIFRTSGLIDSASQICHEIADQLNKEPRAARGWYTPLQLLGMSANQRQVINSKYRNPKMLSDIKGLVPLHVGNTVRLIKMTRKEQETNKIKGFAPKWTKRLYTVLRKTKLRKNPYAFKYHIGLPDSYYR